MFKFVSFVFCLFALLGCSSAPQNVKPVSLNNSTYDSKVRLSHVKAYLLLGNILKAEELFQSIPENELGSLGLLVQAEMHALKGNSIEAQKVFLSLLADDQFEMTPTLPSRLGGLVDYFCEQKKWPALQGYGKSILYSELEDSNTLNNTTVKNEALTQIGLCFFYQQRWEDTNYWLASIDLTKQVNPLVYLALARVSVEQNQIKNAQELIRQYDQKKQTVDAQSMWTSIEVYLALKQPDMVTKVGENMRSLFSFNEYTSKYILLTKRGRIQAIMNQPPPSPAVTVTTKTNFTTPSTINSPKSLIHIIQKGETLYQLSKRYGVTAPELMAWNPDVVVDDIALGTPIRIMAPKTRFEND